MIIALNAMRFDGSTRACSVSTLLFFVLLAHLPSLALLFTSYGASFYSYIHTPSAVHFRLLFFDIVITSAVLLLLGFLRRLYYTRSIPWLTNKVSTFAVE